MSQASFVVATFVAEEFFIIFAYEKNDSFNGIRWRELRPRLEEMQFLFITA